MFVGDQKPPTEELWTSLALPTEGDPDVLVATLADSVVDLATKLTTDGGRLMRIFETLEGKDPHDWVNELASHYGRQVTLLALAELWCGFNRELVAEFQSQLSGIGRPN